MKKEKRKLLEISNSRKSFAIWFGFALFTVVAFIFMFLLNENVYISLLAKEDGLGENLTAFIYAIAGVILIYNSIKKIKLGNSIQFEALQILLGLFFVFVAGEEISWGQRIFNFGTPAIMSNSNLQGEFNLHNISIFDHNSSIFDQHRALNLFVLINGFFLPIVYLLSTKIRNILNRINFPIVPISCLPFFFLGLLYGQTFAKIFSHWSHTEAKELIFSIGFFIFSLSIKWGTNRIIK